ncbi:Glucose starvation modulator protein [Dirofilaria immitis]
MHRIMKIYHYDNLTDCESACELPCGTTYVIRNDIDERRQFICMQRKAPVVSAFINISTTGVVPFILAAALVLCGLLLITCCCCIRCGCACCWKIFRSRNSSNDPLVNGEFRETLDSKDIGYLKREVDRKIITMYHSEPMLHLYAYEVSQCGHLGPFFSNIISCLFAINLL